MEYGDLIHEMILEHLRRTLSRDYKEISFNKKREKKAEYKGHYPDMILGNHGMVLSLLKIETAESISEKETENWKDLTGLGVKLVLMVPKEMKVRVTDLLWNKGLLDKVSIGTYGISVTMP
jgi:hypothetical protein